MTGLRLPLLGPTGELEGESEPVFEPVPLEALLTAPVTLVVVAGARAARGVAAAAFVRALSLAGLRVSLLQVSGVGRSRDELVRAVDALARESEIVVAVGTAPLALYRATLSIVVGSAAAVSAERGLRTLRARADVDVEDASPALLAALASLVERQAQRTP